MKAIEHGLDVIALAKLYEDLGQWTSAANVLLNKCFRPASLTRTRRVNTESIGKRAPVWARGFRVCRL